jgi:ribosome-associated translation inhibitor RaiA
MQPKATARQMQTVFDVHQFELVDADRRRLENDLDGLARLVEHFPIADLHVRIEGIARTNEVSVKLTLIVPGNTLVANDCNPILWAAFERCVSSLAHGIECYKSRLDREADRQKIEKGTHHSIQPTRSLDLAQIEQAASFGDYAAFRNAMLPFEDAVHARVGRWIQRFPEYEARIGKDVRVSDVTEEVFLLAFDQFESRPESLPLGEWLASLIGPAVKAIMTRTAEELENINLTRITFDATYLPVAT